MKNKVIRKNKEVGLNVVLTGGTCAYWLEYYRKGKPTATSILIGPRRNLRILYKAIEKELKRIK